MVSRAAGLAEMLVAVEGNDADSHWTDTARELLRGLLVYVATLPADRRTMAELRRIVTASERDLADTLAEMQADPEAGQRIPARAAAAHLCRRVGRNARARRGLYGPTDGKGFRNVIPDEPHQRLYCRSFYLI